MARGHPQVRSRLVKKEVRARVNGSECSVHVQRTCKCFASFCSFAAPAGKTMCTTGPKLAGHTYAALICMLFWLPFSWDAGCTRQDRKKLYSRGVLRFQEMLS